MNKTKIKQILSYLKADKPKDLEKRKREIVKKTGYEIDFDQYANEYGVTVTELVNNWDSIVIELDNF